MNITLAARPPFSLPAVIESHGWIRLAPFRKEDHASAFNYVLRLDSGRVVDLRIEEYDGGVIVNTSQTLSESDVNEAINKVRWMLALEQDFTNYYALVRNEPKLAHAEAKASGRVLRCPTLFEDIVKTILTTNTLWAGTIRMTETLVSLYGDPLEADPSRRAFPTPERLAELDEETLRGTARLGYRAPYILELARRTASGELNLETLKNSDLPTSEVRKYLMSIKGVGGYAAANLLMILGRYDYIPVDSWALKLVSHEWHGGAPIEPAEVEATFERWGPWKGLAFWFWDWEYKP
jgi:3-methyladenine DNA glycosylase/8-oxoguanine DNA glycosylase